MSSRTTTKNILSLAVATVILATPISAVATPKHCPPGHAKKGWCEQGERHDSKRVEYRHIRDYDRYGLDRPRDGYVYAVRNEEMFLINRATHEVIEGLGALSYLLSR